VESSEQTKSRYIYRGHVVNLRLDTVEQGDGSETVTEIVEHAECIAVVAVDDRENVLLVRQFRRAIGKELLEIPAGGIDSGESAEDAVRREMQEETGFLPQKLERLGGFYSSPGFCTEYLHLYLATGFTPSRLFAEDTEDISVVRVPVKDVSALLASGRIQDSKSLAGLHMYLTRFAGKAK